MSAYCPYCVLTVDEQGHVEHYSDCPIKKLAAQAAQIATLEEKVERLKFATRSPMMTPEERSTLRAMGGTLAEILGETVGTDVRFAFLWGLIQAQIADARKETRNEDRLAMIDALESCWFGVEHALEVEKRVRAVLDTLRAAAIIRADTQRISARDETAAREKEEA